MGLQVGFFQLATVSSYSAYMTYDENPMFAELQLTPAAEEFSSEHFAFYPSHY